MDADTWVKPYTINDSLGIKSLKFSISIKFIEVTDA